MRTQKQQHDVCVRRDYAAAARVTYFRRRPTAPTHRRKRPGPESGSPPLQITTASTRGPPRPRPSLLWHFRFACPRRAIPTDLKSSDPAPAPAPLCPTRPTGYRPGPGGRWKRRAKAGGRRRWAPSPCSPTRCSAPSSTSSRPPTSGASPASAGTRPSARTQLSPSACSLWCSNHFCSRLAPGGS